MGLKGEFNGDQDQNADGGGSQYIKLGPIAVNHSPDRVSEGYGLFLFFHFPLKKYQLKGCQTLDHFDPFRALFFSQLDIGIEVVPEGLFPLLLGWAEHGRLTFAPKSAEMDKHDR